MQRRNWIYFGILTLLLFPCVLITIKDCDSPLWCNGWQWFIKSDTADMLYYNLSISYIVSYIFYLIVNFVPDWFKDIEKISLRCSIYQEVWSLMSNILYLWGIIGKKAFENGIGNESDMKNINKLFNSEFIKNSSSCIVFSSYFNPKTDNNRLVNWYTKLLRELEKIVARGNTILTRYKYDIPSEIFYDIFYIINESSIVGSLPSAINEVTSFGTIYACLSDCIDFENEINIKEVDKSCKAIINLYYWLDKEYNYLLKHIDKKDIRICKPDFYEYIKS